MVLVDTSVWIRAIYGVQPYVAAVDRLLESDVVAGHALVYGELLIGDRGGRKKLLETYAQFHQAPTVPHLEVVTFVRERGLHGWGVGWIDVHLLASALAERLQLWTVDSALIGMAEDFGV